MKKKLICILLILMFPLCLLFSGCDTSLEKGEYIIIDKCERESYYTVTYMYNGKYVTPFMLYHPEKHTLVLERDNKRHELDVSKAIFESYSINDIYIVE